MEMAGIVLELLGISGMDLLNVSAMTKEVTSLLALSKV